MNNLIYDRTPADITRLKTLRTKIKNRTATEAEFAETHAFLEKVNLYEMHIFKYSKRKGTVAEKMENQVPQDIKNLRVNTVLALEKEIQKAKGNI